MEKHARYVGVEWLRNLKMDSNYPTFISLVHGVITYSIGKPFWVTFCWNPYRGETNKTHARLHIYIYPLTPQS